MPLVGKEIPIIADIYPDPEKGILGAVKITPAIDQNDFEVGERMVVSISCVNEDAKNERTSRQISRNGSLQKSGAGQRS